MSDSSCGPPTSPSYLRDTGHLRDALFGFLVGLALGIGLAFFRDRLDERVRGREELELHSGAPVLAFIPRFSSRNPGPITVSHPTSEAAEAFKSLQVRLQHVANQRSAKTFVVTSSLPGEGKTSTTANLGVAFADAGKRVVMVSADLRRPQLQSYFSGQNGKGLTEVLLGSRRFIDAVSPTGIRNLWVLNTGPRNDPEGTLALLGSGAMRALLTELRAFADFVLIDTPPLLTSSDLVAIGPLTDGALFVADPRLAQRPSIRAGPTRAPADRSARPRRRGQPIRFTPVQPVWLGLRLRPGWARAGVRRRAADVPPGHAEGSGQLVPFAEPSPPSGPTGRSTVVAAGDGTSNTEGKSSADLKESRYDFREPRLVRSLFGYRTSDVRQILADREQVFLLVQSEAQQARAKAEQVKTELDSVRAKLQEQAELSDAMLTRAQTELESAQETLRARSEQVEAAELRATELTTQLETARGELRTARGELEVTSARAQAAEAGTSDLRGELAAARTELAAREPKWSSANGAAATPHLPSRPRSSP